MTNNAPKNSGRNVILIMYRSSVATSAMTMYVCHVVISSATMMSSFRMSAVNEMETMFRNSFSNRISDMIMMAAPWYTLIVSQMKKVLNDKARP
jgi:hypothetical protein